MKAVDGLSFTLHRGETLGIVGESGSGKSVTSLALLGLLNRKRTEISGKVLFKGRDLLSRANDELRQIRGKDISMIFQDPFACLHPMYKVGDQIVEAVRVHEDIPKAQASQRAVELLGAVGIPNPRERVKDYPHQYSGGMRQRAMIAMALVHNPDVLIADEPTTALDVTVQAQILELIDRVKTGVQHRRDPDHARPGRDRRGRADSHGHVRGPRDGARLDRGDLRPAAAPVHVGPARVDPARRAEGLAASCRSRARRRR